MNTRDNDRPDAPGPRAAGPLAAPRPVAPRILAAIAAIVLGAIFLAAAFLKAADIALFGEQVASYGIVEGGAARLTALLLVPLEALLGASLVTGFRRRLAAAGTAMLLVLFIVVTAWAWSQGRGESCGCFGSLSASRGPAQVIVEDLVFLGLALVVLFTGARTAAPRFTTLRGAGSAACAGAAVLFAYLAPALPIDDWVTALRPGVTAEELGFGHVFVDDTPALGALLDLDSGTIDETVAALNAIAGSGTSIRVAAFAAADETARGRFFWQHGPLFEIHETAADAMRPLYRRLPRLFLVVDGSVVRTWNDGVPTPGQVEEALNAAGASPAGAAAGADGLAESGAATLASPPG